MMLRCTSAFMGRLFPHDMAHHDHRGEFERLWYAPDAPHIWRLKGDKGYVPPPHGVIIGTSRVISVPEAKRSVTGMVLPSTKSPVKSMSMT